MKNKTSFILIIAIFACLSPVVSQMSTSGNVKTRMFYLSPDGNDSNPGTAKAPWKTLDKANSVLKPGEAVILRDGLYSGLINPVNNGESASRTITYKSENRYGAVLTGQKGSNYIITLSVKNFIVIDGFKMLPEDGGFGMIRECDYITLQNCHMEKSSRVYCPLEFIDGDHHRLLYNNLHRVIMRTRDSRIHGDGCHFINSSYNLIEGNDFSKIGHSPLRIWSQTPHKANFNVIRGNCFHNGWGRNFELFNLDRSLFERNIITDAFNGTMSADARAKMFLTDGIIRNCFIYDNWDNPLASDSYIDKPTTGDAPLELRNSRIYNNTFANNPSYLWSFGSSAGNMPILKNIFMNNIFSNNDYVGDHITLMMVRSGITDDNMFYNNLFHGSGGNPAFIRIKDQKLTGTELNTKLSGQAEKNIDADPLFINPDNSFFAPGENSPALNAGKPLARTIGAGSGKVVSVTDARCFFDGFGIEGETGDMIVIGNKKTMVRIVKSDIDKNVLTLDRNVSWEDNAPVSLPYAGSSPDIGAIQFGNTGVFNVFPYSNPVATGTGHPISFKAMVTGSKGKVNLEWDFGDGTIVKEISPSHSYKNYGDYIVRLKGTDGNGSLATGVFFVRIEKTADPKAPLMQTGFEEEDFEEWGHLWDRGPSREGGTFFVEKRNDGKGQCMCVSSGGNNATLATNVKMRIWDIDKYPNITFKYRIPKGVPVGVWLDTWPSERYANHICIAGSPANSAGTNPDTKSFKLIDDDQWHVAELDARQIRKVIPDIKLVKIFGFSTNTQAVEGQKFWFDDFSITPDTK